MMMLGAACLCLPACLCCLLLLVYCCCHRRALLSAGQLTCCLLAALKGINLGPGSTGKTVNSAHWWFLQWEEKGDHPLRYFLEPCVLTMNFAKAKGYEDVYMAGLSGGGWTTTFAPAIDKRIKGSFPIAGSVPCAMRNPLGRVPGQKWTGSDAEDYEQSCMPSTVKPGKGDQNPGRPAFAACNYTCQYLLAGLEPGRFQVQILHERDSCCFSPQGRHSQMLGYQHNVRAELQLQGGSNATSLHGWFTTTADDHRKHEVAAQDKTIISAVASAVPGEGGFTPGSSRWEQLPCDIMRQVSPPWHPANCAANVEPGKNSPKPPQPTPHSVEHCKEPPCVVAADRCTESASQLWHLNQTTQQGGSSAAAGKQFTIVHAATGKCLTALASQSHALLTLSSCHPAAGSEAVAALLQQWTTNADHHMILAGSQLCLNIGIPLFSPSSLLQLYPIQSGASNEVFMVNATAVAGGGFGGAIRTGTPAGGCVDVLARTKTDDADIFEQDFIAGHATGANGLVDRHHSEIAWRGQPSVLPGPNPFANLPRLPKTHHSWPICGIAQTMSGCLRSTDETLVDYARVTGALPLGLDGVNCAGGSCHAKFDVSFDEPSVGEAVAICKIANCSLTLQFSPWCMYYSSSDPREQGPAEDAEMAFWNARLVNVSIALAKYNTLKGASVAVSAIMVDSEKFSVVNNESMRAAIVRKNDLIFNASVKVFPGAHYDAFGRGEINRQTFGDRTLDGVGGYQTWHSAPGMGAWETIPDRGDSFSVSMYTVMEPGYTRQAMNRTANSCEAHKDDACASLTVLPWIALGCGYRRSIEREGQHGWDSTYNYETVHSWMLGRELNDDYYSTFPSKYARWDYARRAVFYPSIFAGGATQVLNTTTGVNQSAMVLHFLEYVAGACSGRTLCALKSDDDKQGVTNRAEI
jgi:hypothetical protein